MTTQPLRNRANQPLPALMLKYMMTTDYYDYSLDGDCSTAALDAHGEILDPNDGACPWHPAVMFASRIKTMWQDCTPNGAGRNDSFYVHIDLWNATGHTIPLDDKTDRKYVGRVSFLYNPALPNGLPLDYLAEEIYDFLAEYEGSTSWKAPTRLLRADLDPYGVDADGWPISADWAGK